METNDIAKVDFVPGDWMKMEGPGFTIYGKVTARDPKDGQVRMITSTVYDKSRGPRDSSNEIRFVKINKECVPQRARLNVLNRISHPAVPNFQDPPPYPGLGLT